MTRDQVTHILTTITIATTMSEVQLKQNSTELFHEVKNLLQSLTNAVLEKVPKMDVLQRVSELCTRKRVRIMQIPPQELDT